MSSSDSKLKIIKAKISYKNEKDYHDLKERNERLTFSLKLSDASLNTYEKYANIIKY
jgi:hypothetical protein